MRLFATTTVMFDFVGFPPAFVDVARATASH